MHILAHACIYENLIIKYVQGTILKPRKKAETSLIYIYRLLQRDYVRTYIFIPFIIRNIVTYLRSHLTKIWRIKSHKENSVFRK